MNIPSETTLANIRWLIYKIKAHRRLVLAFVARSKRGPEFFESILSDRICPEVCALFLPSINAVTRCAVQIDRDMNSSADGFMHITIE